MINKSFPYKEWSAYDPGRRDCNIKIGYFKQPKRKKKNTSAIIYLLFIIDFKFRHSKYYFGDGEVIDLPYS